MTNFVYAQNLQNSDATARRNTNFSEVMQLFSQECLKDTVFKAEYIAQKINYRDSFPFINYDKNFIQWANDEKVKIFYEKLKKTHCRKLKMLHIGDSHVQFDLISGTMRDYMQQNFGYGGRGLIMPYSAMNTHSAYDYASSHRGKWEYAKNVQRDHHYPVGVTGATVYTNDRQASLKFVFRKGFVNENFTKIKIFCKTSPESYDIRVHYSEGQEPISVSCANTDQLFVEVNLPTPSNAIELFMEKTDSNQRFFECYGISVETPTDSGVLYNSVGINGAGYKSTLRQALFPKQLQELDPDFVMIDLGGNDFRPGKIDTQQLKNDLSTIIDMVQKTLPDALIMVTNAQDCYWNRGKRNIHECGIFAKTTEEVSFAKKCAYYNYYDISGGRYSMLEWRKNNLAQQDYIHLTSAGYRVKGNLYVNALMNSFYTLLANPRVPQLFLPESKPFDMSEQEMLSVNDSDPKRLEARNKKLAEKEAKNSAKTETKSEIVAENKKTYLVKKGDNLGWIAQKFGVSVKELKAWNNIKKNKIKAGSELLVFQEKSVLIAKKTEKAEKAPAQAKEQKTEVLAKNEKNIVKTTNFNAPANAKGSKYTVKKRDSLWKIAKRLNVSVEKIRSLNKLKSDELQVGDILIIK